MDTAADPESDQQFDDADWVIVVCIELSSAVVVRVIKNVNIQKCFEVFEVIFLYTVHFLALSGGWT